MTACCVCSSERHWRCGIHGPITPEMRATRRQGRTPAQLLSAETAAVSPNGLRVASSPDPQLTLDGFPEWDGTLPVPYDVVPY